MSNGPKGVSSHSSINFVPSVKAKVDEFVTKTKSFKPPQIPISSIKFSLPTDLLERIQQNAIPLAMQLKALSIFTVKSLIIKDVIANMQVGLTGIGGLFVGINIPAAAVNTFSLVKNWSSMSWKNRVFLGSSTLANYALSGAGISLLLAKAPAFSGLLSKASALTATKVAFILGPIGMAVISLVSTSKGVLAAKTALEFSTQEDMASRLLNQANAGLGKDLLAREKARFATLTQFAIADSAKYLLIGIGIGIGAAFMAGLLAQPWGWVALSLVGAGTAISIGTLVVRLRKSAEKEKTETDGIVADLVNLLRADFNFSTDFQGKTEEEIKKSIQKKLKGHIKTELRTALKNVKGLETNLRADFTTEEHLEEIINSQTWVKNPTLLELVTQSIYKEINPS